MNQTSIDIKFIWVKEYNSLHNLGINFNHAGDHRFEYKGDSLILSDNKKSILDFGGSIRGITAIAGENGSGKSSICEIILSTTATLTNRAFSYNIKFVGIVCYQNYIFLHNTLQVNNLEELRTSGYNVVEFADSPFEAMTTNWVDIFIKGGFIYYSHVLDRRSYINELNLSNISSQEYLSQSYRYSSSYPIDDDIYGLSENRRGIDKKGEAEIYFQGEANMQTEFYLSFPDLIPFQKPSDFAIKSTYSGNSRWLNINRIENTDVRRHINELQNSIFHAIHRSKTNPPENEITQRVDDNFKRAIHQLYRLNLLILVHLDTGRVLDFDSMHHFIFHQASAEGSFENHTVIDELLILHQQILRNADEFSGDFNAAQWARHYNFIADWRYKLIEFLWLPVNDENHQLLARFIELESEAIQPNKYPIKRLHNYAMNPVLSAGESSFMTLFSRLYDVIKRHMKSEYERSNFILFIDEAEIGFHPAWKKHFLKWLLDFLNSEFHNFTCQLIITTHSPYLLSDLTPDHILLLTKNKNGFTEIVDSSDYDTFGANIHDLLSKSFFLKDGLIGEFAKKTIQHVIDQLNAWRRAFIEDPTLNKTSPQITFEKEKVQQVIAVIADPIVRNKLYEMYWEVFSEEDMLELEINLLKDRIESLEKRRKQ